MKHIKIIYLVAGLVAAGSSGLLQAEDAKPQGPKRQEVREQVKSLPPEERGAKLKEMREGQGMRPQTPPNIREELGKLPPAEREARLKELREKRQAGTEHDRQLLKQRIEQRLAELRKKKEDGTITDQELRQLERGEQMLRSFDQPQSPPADRKPVEKKNR
jgi:cell division protein FtsN